MNVGDALKGVSRLYLDTAPVVYFIEENAAFFSAVVPFFEYIEQGGCLGVVGPVTLAECLVMPFKNQSVEFQQQFTELMTNTEGIEPIGLSSEAGVLAGKLRAKYNLKLPDALQIATAVSSGCEAILTNDKGMRRVEELKVLVLEELSESINS